MGQEVDYAWDFLDCIYVRKAAWVWDGGKADLGFPLRTEANGIDSERDVNRDGLSECDTLRTDVGG